MSEVIQKTLVSASTTTGTKTHVDVRGLDEWNVFVSATGGTSAAFQIEVTTDPAGTRGWAAAGMRAPGGGAYATTAVTVNAGNGASAFVSPDDAVSWVRINVTANTGPSTVNSYLTGVTA
jgi:hypothetical protein